MTEVKTALRQVQLTEIWEHFAERTRSKRRGRAARAAGRTKRKSVAFLHKEHATDIRSSRPLPGWTVAIPVAVILPSPDVRNPRHARFLRRLAIGSTSSP